MMLGFTLLEAGNTDAINRKPNSGLEAKLNLHFVYD